MWNTDPNDHLYNNMLGSHLAREMGDTSSQSHHVGLETLKILMIIMMIVMILVIIMMIMMILVIMAGFTGTEQGQPLMSNNLT